MVKILVVDDEADVCDFTMTFFKERGFEVLCAATGAEAISLVREAKPDIVLLDILMKETNGISVLKQIKEMASSTVVVMVTAVEDIKRIEEAKALGAEGYITKPLLLDELERKIVTLAAELARRD